MALNAYERGWGDPGKPGSLRARAWRAKNIRKVTVGGVTLYVHKEVAPLFIGLITDLNAQGYRIDKGPLDDWGYANRDVRGRPGVKSNHAWGLAVDLNAATNPMTNDGRTHTDLPSNVRSLAARWGLRWGGDYSGRKDPMHFEFMGTPAQAQAVVRSTSASPTRLASNPWRRPMVSAKVPAIRGAKGDGVRWIEHQLNLTIKGHYDENVVRAVHALQKRSGLVTDGKVGPKTLMALEAL